MHRRCHGAISMRRDWRVKRHVNGNRKGHQQSTTTGLDVRWKRLCVNAASAGHDNGAQRDTTSNSRGKRGRMTQREARRLLQLPPQLSSSTEDERMESIKKAFRRRVKEIHPDVVRTVNDDDDTMEGGEEDEPAILLVYDAYNYLMDVEKTKSRDASGERTIHDPFEDPRAPTEFTFVNELRCLGRGCPPNYCCVNLAPFHFQFADDTGAARCLDDTRELSNFSEDEDYSVYRSVSLCPRECISYCTEAQLDVLQEELSQAITGQTDRQAVGARIDALVAQANYNNGRWSDDE